MARIPCCALLLLIFLSTTYANLSFNFSPFNIRFANSYDYLGNVSVNSDSIDLTTNKQLQTTKNTSGKVYYKDPFVFKNSTAVASFSTSFAFKITLTNNISADGIAFFIQADPKPMAKLGIGGGYLALNGNQDNPFLAVEFDTYQNSPANSIDCNWYDPPGDHVGIDLNSMSSVTNHSAQLTGVKKRAWIDYDGGTEMLELRLANEIAHQRPATPVISAKIDLRSFFDKNDSLYVGLSAATGREGELHTLYSWNFTITEMNASSGLNTESKGSHSSGNTLVAILAPCSIGAVVLAAICSVILLRRWYYRRKKGADLPQECEFQSMVSRISYSALSSATKGFSERELLGRGGFASVYKGIMQDGSTVAVKVMSVEKATHQFAAELSVIGHLKHKNLVGLKGWCHERGKLILVYDYMSNRSLDHHLFSPNKLLSFSQRYEIMKGVAEGLMFLHEGWEQRIVHRDIKAANVLLDHKFVAHLGDFGLSKLLEDNKAQQTMTQAGTRGYIAPELAYMGRASEKSDIYGFGILLLEVACGKSVLAGASESRAYQFLLNWVWEAQIRNDLLSAADPRLNSDYSEEQMRVMLCLGLLCSHPDAELRPSMRKCCQILSGESSLPDLPSSKPTMFFGVMPSNSSLSSFVSSTSSAQIL